MGGSESIIPLPPPSLRDYRTYFRPSLWEAATGPPIRLVNEHNSVCIPVLRSLAAHAVSFYRCVKGQKVVLSEARDGTARTSRTTWYKYRESDTVSQYKYIYILHLYVYYR